MSEQAIHHVSDTAFWVAHFRFLEGQRKDALFQDPLAGVLAGERGRTIAKKMGILSTMQWNLSVRTSIIDSLLQEQVQQGVDTVINLGAGLDTRPYRLEMPATLRWIEVDFPDVIAFKEERLQQAQPKFRLERYKLDLSQEHERRELLSQINAAARKVLVLTEGVVPYLAEEDVASLAQDLFDQPRFECWITDYFSRLFMELWAKGWLKTSLPENVNFRFNPLHWEEFYRKRGWELEQLHYMASAGKKLNRPLPLPFASRLAMPFLSKAKRQALEQIAGYALLRRRSA